MTAAEIHQPRDLYITDELHRRVPTAARQCGEQLALQDIAAQMLDQPERVLPLLVERAMQMTGAASAGISAFEPEEGSAGHFRWRDLRGKLASFEGATTPRNYSPCGVCLDRFEPTLSRRPERHYSWIEEAGVVCPEVLLVPLCMAHDQPLGTLWIVSDNEGHFDSEHAQVLKELASFAGVALAVLQNHRRLQEALVRQEMLTREMQHRLDNVFSVTKAIIQVTQGSATSVADFATTLADRVRALAAAHTLIRERADIEAGAQPLPAVTFRSLTAAIFQPYLAGDLQRVVLSGHDTPLGDKGVTGVALILHELATNAIKHGALSGPKGCVSLSCELQGEALFIRWQEDGGPRIDGPPVCEGFGSSLLHNTVSGRFGGLLLATHWREQGLVVEFALPVAKLAE